MVLACPKCILGKFRICLKISKFFQLFHHSLSIYYKGSEFLGQKWVLIDQIWRDVWETLKNLSFEKIWFLKIVMVLGSSKCIQGDFRIFFKKVHFYFHILSLLAHFLQDRLELFMPRMSPKRLNLVYGKPWKIVILWKF